MSDAVIVSDVDAVADRLRGEIDAAEKLLANGEARRKPHAYKAALGDAAAIAALDAIDEEEAAAHTVLRRAKPALAEARQRQRVEDEREAERLEVARQERVRDLADEIVQVSATADRLLSELSTALDRRKELVARVIPALLAGRRGTPLDKMLDGELLRGSDAVADRLCRVLGKHLANHIPLSIDGSETIEARDRRRFPVRPASTPEAA